VVALVALAQGRKDGQRILLARLADLDHAEATVERRVLGDHAPVFLNGRRPDTAQFAPGEGRLENVGGVQVALHRIPRPDNGVNLVDEQDDVRRFLQLFEDADQPLLKLAAQAGPGDQRAQLDGHDAPVGNGGRGRAVGDGPGQPFDDGRLAHAGIADQQRVVLLAADERPHQAAHLRLAPDGRADLARARLHHQIAPELVQQRRRQVPQQLGRAAHLLHGGFQRLGLAAGFRLPDEQADPVLQVEAQRRQAAGRHALPFLEQGQEQVILGHRVLVLVIGGVDRQGEHQAAARRERDRLAGIVVAHPGGLTHGQADGCRVQVGVGQQPLGAPPLDFGQSDEEVLRAEVIVRQADGLVGSQAEQKLAALADFLFADLRWRCHRLTPRG